MKLEMADRSLPVKNPESALPVNNMPKNSKEAEPIKDIKMPNEAEKKNLPVSEKFIIETIEKANKAISGARTEFRFSIHEDTHEIMIKVLDKDSGETIREIPPEEILDMVAKMWEMAGIIVDEKR